MLLVGLVLRFEPSTLDAEGYSREFYQTVLFVLLTSTALPLMIKTLYKDKMQKAQLLLLAMAGADMDGDSAKSVKRNSLRSKHMSAEQPNPLAVEMTELRAEDSAA